MADRRSQHARVRWLDCLNGTNQTIPSYALAQVTGCDSTGVVTLGAVENDNQDTAVLVATGQTPIPAGAYGICTFDIPAIFCYTVADGVPNVGATWGAKAGDWTLRNGQSGFRIWGQISTGNGTIGRLLAVRATSQGYTGTITQTIVCVNNTPTWSPGTTTYADGMLQTVDGSSGDGGTGPISINDSGPSLRFNQAMNSQYLFTIL